VCHLGYPAILYFAINGKAVLFERPSRFLESARQNSDQKANAQSQNGAVFLDFSAENHGECSC
jgi:hypothetical protein